MYIYSFLFSPAIKKSVEFTLSKFHFKLHVLQVNVRKQPLTWNIDGYFCPPSFPDVPCEGAY